MICVIPFSRSDFPQAVELLKWINELGGCHQHSCLLVVHSEFQWSDATRVLELANKAFRKASLIASQNKDIGWPRAANDLFLTAATYIHEKLHEPFFWCDPDCIPLKSGWLDALQTAYEKANKPFLGRVYSCSDRGLPSQLLSGIAVYPSNAIESIGPHCHASRAWDVEAVHTMLQNGADADLIQWFWGQPNLAPTFAREKTSQSPINTFTLHKLEPNAVVFHRNKDGTLIKLLRERLGLHKNKGTLVVRRTAALGDTLAATVVADKLIEMGFKVEFQSHSACHCILRRHPRLSRITEPNGHCDVNLDNAYEPRVDRHKNHFSNIFIETANNQLRSQKINISNAWNATAKLVINEAEKAEPLSRLEKYPRPWVFICPKSYSHINRTVPDGIWQTAASKIKATCFWLGMEAAPSGIVDFRIRHVDNVIRYLACADLLVSTDTGPMHIAAALGTPVVAIEQSSSPTLHLTNQRDFVTVVPPNLTCLNCQKEVCPIHASDPPCRHVPPDLIAHTVNRRLAAYYGEDTTAVICIYRGDTKRLNKCIEHVMPQVQEVVISSDGDGSIPPGVIKSDKIIYAQNRTGKRLGYGKNANHGCRHSNGKYILLLNDDVFLASDAVERMKEVMDDKTGLVGQLLRYPDGTIQHGGSYRNPGDPGWGHIDHRARHPRITEPCEMESVTLASALVRRKAFYEVMGFDERFDCYCEDNDMCMKMRKAGWKVMYQPKATGIHIEHQTTMSAIEGYRVMKESCRIFGEKWHNYFVWNKNRIPGNFDYTKL